MKRNIRKWAAICSVTLTIIGVWIIGSAAFAYADDYYDTNKIYTEGIYVADGVYVEPCFEHFESKDKQYPALKVEGDMPQGTQYKIYIHYQDGSFNKTVSSEIPNVPGLGIYKVDVIMPNGAPVTFQAEGVLEGLAPSAAIVGQTTADDYYSSTGEPMFRSFMPTSDYSRDTFNIRRGESPGPVPSPLNGVVQRKLKSPSVIWDHVSNLREVRPHTILLDIKSGPMGALGQVLVGTQVYKEGYSFATHEEMQANRDAYGDWQ